MFYFLITFLINSNTILHKPIVKITPAHIAKQYLIKTDKIKKLNNTELPSKVDLCDKLPAVRTQSSQGSCVAWAAGYYYKTFQEAREMNWDVNDEAHICSPSFVYNQVNSGNDDGSFPLDAIRLIRTSGCASLKDMPYNPDDNETLPNKDQQLKALKMRAQNFNFFYVGTNNINTGKRSIPVTDETLKAMKAHLNNGDAFIISIPYFSEFGQLRSNFFTKDHNLPSNLDGGHAMVVCGYDDTVGNGAGGFRVKNSWGTDWAEDGLAYLSYDFMKYFSNEAIYMDDRIDYQPEVIAEIDIEDIKRKQIAFMALGNSGVSPLLDFLSFDGRLGFHQILDLTDLNIESSENYLFNFLNIHSNGSIASLENLKILNYLDNSVIKDYSEKLPISISGETDLDITGKDYISIHYDKNAFDYTTTGGAENTEGYLGIDLYFRDEGYLEAVDFFTTYNDTDYQLFIYNTPDEFINNKENYLYTSKGFSNDMGWHTLTLDERLTIKAKTSKFIIIKYKNENGSILPVEAYPNLNAYSYSSIDGKELKELKYAAKIRARQKLETLPEIKNTEEGCNYNPQNTNIFHLFILLISTYLIKRKKEQSQQCKK